MKRASEIASMFRSLATKPLATLLGTFALATTFSCSTTFTPATCATDGDCGDGLACFGATDGNYCRNSAEVPIRIGISAPISSAALGIDMRAGVELAFAEQLKKGGIHGRPIKLEFRDDGYDPTNAEAAAKELTAATASTTAPVRCPVTTLKSQDATPNPVSTTALLRGPNAVLALLGNVGTPTMVRAAPVALETGTLYFGAFTGAAAILRDGRAGADCSRYVFNVRASYANEARATLEYFIKNGIHDADHLLSFDQNDGFGDAGYNGLKAAYASLSGNDANKLAALPDGASIARYRYTRGDVQSVTPVVATVTKQLATLLQTSPGNHTVGVMMTDTYGPAAAFIRGLRDWQYAADAEQTALKKGDRLTLLFNNVSFVGPNALAKQLANDTKTYNPSKPYSNGVFVSQVVPNYQTDKGEISRQYRQLSTDAGLEPSFTAFEGYISGRIFSAGLLQNGKKSITPESMITALETMPDLALGLGGAARYSADSHNYLKSIWVTAIAPDATFIDRYYWADKGIDTISIEEF
jgi:ABC-type branched-subunit amino acid transport system substrate-binding protein